MLTIDLVTLFPEMLSLACGYGITRRAIATRKITLNAWNPRDYALDERKTVDDRPFGGGPGMVLMYRPLQRAIHAARSLNKDAKVIYLNPQGRKLDQTGVKMLAKYAGLILVAGRYAGIDQRLLDKEIDEEWSIGDYVLSGGELAALVLIDAVIRMLPGVLGNDASVAHDSFFEDLLGYPQYTRPETVDGVAVPAILLSGDHMQIQRWRMQQAIGQTWLRRPDLLDMQTLDKTGQDLLAEFKRQHKG